METSDDQYNRLVQQAALMRERRHAAAPNLDAQLDRTQRVINRLAPDNMASIPLAMAFENKVWTVDIHVRTETEEYESTGTARKLEDAIASARLDLYVLLEKANDAYRTAERAQS